MNWQQLRDNVFVVLIIKANFLEQLGKGIITNNITSLIHRRSSEKMQYENKDFDLKDIVKNLGVSLDEKELDKNTYVTTQMDDVVNNSIVEKNIFPCPYMKNIPEFDIKNMLDVWQIAYYRMPKDLSCFKLYIKEITVPEQRRYAEFLGTFNDSVSWKNCLLEIQSNGNLKMRMHFLGGMWREKGIFENIIIDEEMTSGTARTYLLNEKTNNQWFAYKNLLLMRDCDTGYVVVFSKVPKKPLRREVEEALLAFGFEELQELKACVEF